MLYWTIMWLSSFKSIAKSVFSKFKEQSVSSPKRRSLYLEFLLSLLRLKLLRISLNLFSHIPYPAVKISPESDHFIPHPLLLLCRSPSSCPLSAGPTSTLVPCGPVSIHHPVPFFSVCVSLCGFFAQHLPLVCHLTKKSPNPSICDLSPIVPYHVASCSLLTTWAFFPLLNTSLCVFLRALGSAEPEHPSPKYW